MRKRTRIMAPALIVGVLLIGGYKYATQPAAAPASIVRAAAATQNAGSTPALLAEAGAEAPSAPLLAVEPVTVATGDEAVPATAEPTTQPTAVPTAEPTATARPTATDLPQATAAAEPSATAKPTRAAPPTATPQAAPPDRIVAPAIGLDAKVVTVGWHEVVDQDGKRHTEWDVASYAAGWHKNSARPGQIGNMVLSGHNNIEGEVFRNLEKFQIGDQITLYAGDRTFNYVVSEKFVVPDKGIAYEERVKNAKWIGSFPDERLTLVSCWPPTNNTHRMFIIAKPQK